MTRGRVLSAGAVLGLVAVAGLLAPGVRCRLWGLWQREAFYRGRPTSYWRRQILDYPNDMAAYERTLPPSWRAVPAYAPASPVDEVRKVCGVYYRYERVPFPFEGNSPAAVPLLIELLRDSDPVVRRYAADCLGDLGPAAAPAVPALLRALGDEEQGGMVITVGGAAAYALQKIDPEAAARAGVPRD